MLLILKDVRRTQPVDQHRTIAMASKGALRNMGVLKIRRYMKTIESFVGVMTAYFGWNRKTSVNVSVHLKV